MNSLLLYMYLFIVEFAKAAGPISFTEKNEEWQIHFIL